MVMEPGGPVIRLPGDRQAQSAQPVDRFDSRQQAADSGTQVASHVLDAVMTLFRLMCGAGVTHPRRRVAFAIEQPVLLRLPANNCRPVG